MGMPVEFLLLKENYTYEEVARAMCKAWEYGYNERKLLVRKV